MNATNRVLARADERFFLWSAIAMALVIVAGFSLQLTAGRSSFQAPMLVHVHGVVFMGWLVIFLAQNALIATGRVGWHRPLGWLAAAWLVPMLVLGWLVTVAMVREGRVPFFFRPLQFLIFDPLSLVTFIGLTIAAIALRRSTDWHRRLHYSAMAILVGPGVGRLLPMPLLAPWAWEATLSVTLLFPIVGMLADQRRMGRVHPAWMWGLGVQLAMIVTVEAITYAPLGTLFYDAVVAGSPGAAVAPLDLAPPPGPPPVATGSPP
ncbi:hypothetical protein BZG35_04560 [Brevundimonas sp. LM2]|uniref:hypothetical protein n=1 Tax=Brevundimonas sp. LM2 TaxID=1938605 RepID=UPI000983E348|nr:hypothetical protein [Brevundimonas sp. LM2]AQR61013.1 hypothetical protein BZG35_04560 [Brevundimonas sp. LM2]